MPRRSRSQFTGRCAPGTALVYAATIDGRTHKIGWTTNLRGRMKTLQTSLETEIRVTDTIEASATQAPLIEKQIHRDYNHLRTRGEWFTMDEVLVCDIFAFARIRWVSDPGLAWA